MDLFEQGRQAQIVRESPLANRMRPRTLDEYVGQGHILAPGRLLRRAIEADQLSSLILYGPPGTGKTTLAAVIANSTRSHFITINAVLAGVKEIREAIADATERRTLYGQRTTLFVDEVHRWNKAQQDALLPHVERGTILLIGATTENPYFEVNKALVSRSRIFQLRPLGADDLRTIAHHALRDPERGYGKLAIALADDALDHLVNVANGDARGVLNALELAVETTPPNADGVIMIDLAVAEESIQRRAVLYDKDGDAHYDTISAFIKSLRGSDPDAALYWAARMVYAGEDPRFIFRRMGIFAGEDIGMADPHAATVVANCWELFERIGMPEGQFPLTTAILYLATAPKSNSAFAYFDALNVVQAERSADVPNHLKDGSRDSQGFGHGAGYKYPHAYQQHWVAQQYLPAALQGRTFYQPGDQGYEGQLAATVQRRREEQLAALQESDDGTPELLTFSPPQRGRDAWLQRTLGNSGATLGRIRDRLFALAEPQRHHLLLDLHAGSGLLLWEALRRAPEGGVWGIAPPALIADLGKQAERLPELDRPTLLPTLAALLERGQRFDRLLAYNLLADLHGGAAQIADWHALLLAGGRVVLAQPVPRLGQQLHALIDWGAAAALGAQVATIEAALWTAPDNPLTAWTVADFAAMVAAAGWHATVTQETLTEERRLARALVAKWFTADSAYAQALARQLAADEVEHIKRLYLDQLADRVVNWSTQVLFAVLSV